jgi:RimJ/RimL family protein N-acetyltransferase
MGNSETAFEYLQSDDQSTVVLPLHADYYPGLVDVAWSDAIARKGDEDQFWHDFGSIDMIHQKVAESARSNAQWHVILARGVVAGAMYDQQVPFTTPTTNIGYWISREFEGRGHVSASVRLLSKHILESGISEVVIASPREDNEASIRVLERSGFQKQKSWRAKYPPYKIHVTYEKRRKNTASTLG